MSPSLLQPPCLATKKNQYDYVKSFKPRRTYVLSFPLALRTLKFKNRHFLLCLFFTAASAFPLQTNTSALKMSPERWNYTLSASTKPQTSEKLNFIPFSCLPFTHEALFGAVWWRQAPELHNAPPLSNQTPHSFLCVLTSRCENLLFSLLWKNKISANLQLSTIIIMVA